ncbi:MAG: hypothetical protein C0404_14605 [Verrucomicrobia bacterium]|nr:hypothetical protein [Verrucomicrobiota bacterium]
MMKIMFDLNILLDVIQQREVHFNASALVCAMAVRKDIAGFVPVHAVTTIAYIVRKHAGSRKEAEALDWLLANFSVAAEGHKDILRARNYRLLISKMRLSSLWPKPVDAVSYYPAMSPIFADRRYR